MSDDKPANAIPLAYGDIILISSPFNDNFTLFSDGIVKSQIYLKNFGSGTKKKSFYRSLFQIYPSFINTHKTQALAIREAKGNVSETQEKKEKLEELKEKLNFEYKFNLEHFEKVRNTPITYGNSIQFLHLASNKFLACHFTEAEVEKENYKLELVDIPSEASNFKISPSYKHQKENEGYIYYKDLVYINFANNYLNKTPYLHCNHHLEQGTLILKKTMDSERLSQAVDSPPKRRTSSNARSSHSHGTGVSINQNLKSEDNVHGGDKKAGKKEINVSLVKCRWKINLFAHESEDKSFLSYGDTIWMNHAEHNASMIARKEKNGEVDFVQTIISDANQQYSGNTNGMWIIENQGQSNGGLVEWDDEFRLKHLSSGKYLSVDYSHLKKKHILKLDAEKNEDSLFKFELMPTLMIEHLPQYYKNINKEAFIRIRSAATKLWLHVEHIGDRLEGYLLPEVIDDDIFKLFKANSNEIWETNFLISCFPILQNYLVGLEETSGKVVIVDEQTAYQKIEKRAKEAQECLMQLELFCTNRLLNTSLDQKYGEVNPYRQKVLREQYFLETLGEILKYSFTEAQIENYLSEKDNQEDLKNKKGYMLQKLARKAKIQSGKGNDFFLMEQKISICRLIYRLFKSICKENAENEMYAYHIIDQFQYHAKYLEEAVDCFISIVNSNEGILSRIGEDIKVNEVLEQLTQPAGAAAGPKKKIKLFNLSLALGIKDPNDYESQNFITYFLKLIYDNSGHKRNLSYLRFLKTICVCDEKGMTINQEHLYKIFAAAPALDKATFMETIIDEDAVRIRVDEQNLIALADCFKLDTNPSLWKNEMSYFLEQVSFYSTLLEGRNYLWKMKLEKQFPAGVVFEQIYNENLSLEIRSVFCDLALALYIDQEPLNPRIVPNLCRVFKKKKRGASGGSMTYSFSDNTHKLAQIDKANFVKLLENIVKIVEDQKKKILDELQGKCENVSEAKIGQLKFDNYLNNIVLAKLVKLLCKMVSFDLFLLLDGKSNYYQIVHDLLHILEFDKNSPTISYALMKIRDENFKKSSQESKNKVFNVIGDFAGLVGDLSKDLVGNLKNVAGAVFGAEKKKTRSEIVGIIEEGDDGVYVNNPIMKGLILLKNQIDQLNIGQSIEANNTEIMIKGEICDLMNYMLDLRQDYLLSNVLGWYEDVVPQITGKVDNDIHATLASLIEREVASVFPDISRTGLADVDAKYRPKEDNVVLDGLKNISKLIIKSKKQKQPPKLTKFTNYTEEEEFPDLDTLFTGLNMTGKKEILPSLLTSFYLANDTHLENKLLTLIMRIFGQREEAVDNLQKLEMVFERDDVEAYYKLERWSEDLRLQTQRSEIWLSDFIITKGEKDWELKNVMKLFRDITNLVFGTADGTDKNLRSRQNMMRNLASYSPMIGMIRDGAFHMKNALEDPNLPPGPKQQLLELFAVAHACLICFCHNNPENQELLSSHMKLFLSNLNIDIGQITLICEICKDNKEVCESFADLIITSLLDVITKYGHKASFLDPLTALQKHKTAFLVENHIKIMNRFITASRALEETELKALYASINPDTKEVELTFQKILPMDEPFVYHAKLFDVLMFDSEGNDSLIFTHTRLRKVFTVPYCLRLVQQISVSDRLLSARGIDVNDVDINLRTEKRRSSVIGHLPAKVQHKYSTNMNTSQTVIDNSEDGFRLLKPKVIQILGTLYLKGDKILAEEFLEHLDLFVDFIKSEKDGIQNLSEEFRPSQEFTDYLFRKLLCFVRDYVEKLILSNTDEARDRRDSAAILELVDIVYSKFPSLGLKINKDDAINFRALVRHYIDEGSVTNSQVPYMLDSILRTKDSQRAAADEQPANTNEPPKKRYVYFESKEAASYSIYWQDFLNATTQSKTLTECIKNERAALSEAIWKFEEIFPKEYRKKYKIEVEAKDILRKLITFLRDGQKNKADKGTMIATLRVLKEIIESAPDVTEMQTFFDKNDATRMLLTVLSDPKLNSMDDDLLNEFLEFGIALLEGGNQNVQKTIYNFCTVYSMSQLMFAKFHSIIYGQIVYLQARADLKDDPIKSLELEQAHGLKSEILERLLRFLQLFTEGHYEELQDYLRYQTNSRNRYNIVEAVIDLLNTYSMDLVQSNYENIIKCLDTLNEFVQGPCKENQIALVDGKFFDVVLTLFNKKIRSKAKNRRKSKPAPESVKKSTFFLAQYMAEGATTPQQSRELEPWMLTRLKYKVLILVNSLLERSSKSVIKRVMRSLPLEVLKKNLLKIFKKYKELYGNTFVMESLKHFDGDPNDQEEEEKPPGYYELITESGFMIYFLICSYTDLDTQDIDPDLLNEINELKVASQSSMKSSLKNNVFMQLMSFGYTLFKSLVDSGNEIREGFEKRFRKSQKLEVKENEEEKRIRKSLENQQLNKEAMQFFGQNSTSIEVARLGEVERIQFMVLPYCQELPKDEKKAFNEDVNRQNPKTKVEGLVNEADKLIDVCKHELKLKIFFNRRKFIAIFTNFVNLWKDLAFLLSIVLNFLILTSYSNYFGDPGDIDGGRMSDPELFLSPDISTETSLDVFLAIGIAMAFCSIFVVFFFFLKRVPLILKKALNEKSTLMKAIKIVYYSLQSVDIVYYIAYGVFAVIGTIVHPFFFSMHLTEILFRYPTLKNVIKSVWIPRKQLALTFLLFLILTYFFSLYAYAYMDDIYDGNCESTLLCFKTTFDGTFKANGGIGGFNVARERGDFNTERFIFDNLANIILLIIMINIVAGIIIDTFGLLREQEEEKNSDIQEKCFICGLDKDVFDRQADSSYNFHVHIKKEHNMWAYVFFLAHLKEKDETEYTGIESYISDKVKNQEYNWFPFSRALSLKHYDEQESENTQEALDCFNAEADEIKKSMKSLNDAYASLTSRMNIN